VDLDGKETLNPWDLMPGERAPGKQKVAFLKNLVLYMIGDSGNSDRQLLENVLSEAIIRTYKRVGVRQSNPIPTTSDLRDELAQWRDEDGLPQAVAEARLAAAKLRSWTGERGIYAKLFDRHTSMDLHDDWLFFNVEKLGDEPHLATAMSLVVAQQMAERMAGKAGRNSIMVLDECWFLLDSPILAPQVVQLFRTARSRGGSVWGISQTIEDFVGTPVHPRPQGPGIIKNVKGKFLGQQQGDLEALETHLHLNSVALEQLKLFSDPQKGKNADVLLVLGEKAKTTQTLRIAPSPLDYWICTTYRRERVYRRWWLAQQQGEPLIEAYKTLAARFPYGLSDCPLLPEEESGEVYQVL
jgi:TraG P-loop domain